MFNWKKSFSFSSSSDNVDGKVNAHDDTSENDREVSTVETSTHKHRHKHRHQHLKERQAHMIGDADSDGDSSDGSGPSSPESMDGWVGTEEFLSLDPVRGSILNQLETTIEESLNKTSEVSLVNAQNQCSVVVDTDTETASPLVPVDYQTSTHDNVDPISFDKKHRTHTDIDKISPLIHEEKTKEVHKIEEPNNTDFGEVAIPTLPAKEFLTDVYIEQPIQVKLEDMYSPPKLKDNHRRQNSRHRRGSHGSHKAKSKKKVMDNVSDLMLEASTLKTETKSKHLPPASPPNKVRDCAICLFPIVDGEKLISCGHEFCKSCIDSIRTKLVEKSNRKRNRRLRRRKKEGVRTGSLDRVNMNISGSGAKNNTTLSFLEDIEEVEEEVCPLCSTSKSAMFIQQRWNCRGAFETERLRGLTDTARHSVKLEENVSDQADVEFHAIDELDSDQSEDGDDERLSSNSAPTISKTQLILEWEQKYDSCLSKLEESEASRLALESQLANINEELSKWKEKSESSKEPNKHAIKEDQKKMETYKEELDKATKLIKNLRSEKSVFVNKITKLDLELKSSNSMLSMKEKESQSLCEIQTEVTKLQELLRLESEKSNCLMKELEIEKSKSHEDEVKLKEEVSSLTKILHELENKLQLKEIEHTKMAESNSKLDQSNQELQQKFNVLHAKSEEQDKEFKLETDKLIAFHNRAMDDLRYDHAKQIDELQSRMKEITDSSTDLTQRASLVLKDSQSKQKAEMEKVQSRQADKIKGLTSTIRSLQAKFEESNRRLIASKAAMKGRLSSDSDRILWLREQLKEVHTQRTAREQQNDSNSPVQFIELSLHESKMKELRKKQNVAISKLQASYRVELENLKQQYSELRSLSKSKRTSDSIERNTEESQVPPSTIEKGSNKVRSSSPYVHGNIPDSNTRVGSTTQSQNSSLYQYYTSSTSSRSSSPYPGDVRSNQSRSFSSSRSSSSPRVSSQQSYNQPPTPPRGGSPYPYPEAVDSNQSRSSSSSRSSSPRASSQQSYSQPPTPPRGGSPYPYPEAVEKKSITPPSEASLSSSSNTQTDRLVKSIKETKPSSNTSASSTTAVPTPTEGRDTRSSETVSSKLGVVRSKDQEEVKLRKSSSIKSQQDDEDLKGIKAEVSGFSVGKMAQLFESKKKQEIGVSSKWDVVRNQRSSLKVSASATGRFSGGVLPLNKQDK